MNKIILILLLLAFNAGSVLIAQDYNNRELLEKAMVDEATTKEQKKALVKYFKAIAKEKRKLADRLSEDAKIGQGGKAGSNQERSKKLKAQAEGLRSLADSYDEKAKNLDEEADKTK